MGSVAVVNTEQEAAWNGYEGEHWAEHDDRWNAVNAGFNEPLLRAAALTPGLRVLDVGCGAGQTSRLAARAVAAGQVLGLDLSAPELARARERAAAEGLTRLTFERGDAQTHPLPPGSFDVAISRFGIMFFADPVAAFVNIRAALRPGGRLAVLTMADPSRVEWVQALAATRPHLPVPDFTVGQPGMFSLADPETFRRVLAQAGYEQVNAELVEAPMRFGDDATDAADFLMSSGPGRFLLSRATAQDVAAAREALIAALAPHQSGTDGVQLAAAAWLVTARNPQP
ncbi:class I SAM-dependent methyltransferase [Streptacidiphilus jiangxiensis]|uniref:Ubiquinone/menaquinone biosynthesis C-methylase UbiE n=1 Tax=Streptacidiphilus jiangxiensis TaxID=235985 RepID=A0A1H7WIU2_STRJI|nr:class I SAM-dependent methyltransferase [Streptacidiphilus jiangxiensis]SEM20918.1 Ubiquinone/menaquinone biosynthesis C-methylase UbiE [Streptacidiphilus jiangxiensis]